MIVAITGAGSGIGRALASQLAREGHGLALSDINTAGLEETAQVCRGLGASVTTRTLDVSDRAAVFSWADEVVRDHGAVHAVINNAGVALSGTAQALSIEDYEWIMGINFWGVVYGTKAFLPHLERAAETSGVAHVVNLSSVFGLTAQPLMGGYNASKFAVRGYTEALRQDLELMGSKVVATCVHPGGIKTNIAKASRQHESTMAATGATAEKATREFEKLFITSPASAASTILAGMRARKRRVLIGPDARMFDLIVRLFPTGYQWLFTAAVKSKRAKA